MVRRGGGEVRGEGKRVRGEHLKKGNFIIFVFASLSFRLGDSVRWVLVDGENRVRAEYSILYSDLFPAPSSPAGAGLH